MPRAGALQVRDLAFHPDVRNPTLQDGVHPCDQLRHRHRGRFRPRVPEGELRLRDTARAHAANGVPAAGLATRHRPILVGVGPGAGGGERQRRDDECRHEDLHVAEVVLEHPRREQRGHGADRSERHAARGIPPRGAAHEPDRAREERPDERDVRENRRDPRLRGDHDDVVVKVTWIRSDPAGHAVLRVERLHAARADAEERMIRDHRPARLPHRDAIAQGDVARIRRGREPVPDRQRHEDDEEGDRERREEGESRTPREEDGDDADGEAQVGAAREREGHREGARERDRRVERSRRARPARDPARAEERHEDEEEPRVRHVDGQAARDPEIETRRARDPLREPAQDEIEGGRPPHVHGELHVGLVVEESRREHDEEEGAEPLDLDERPGRERREEAREDREEDERADGSVDGRRPAERAEEVLPRAASPPAPDERAREAQREADVRDSHAGHAPDAEEKENERRAFETAPARDRFGEQPQRSVRLPGRPPEAPPRRA